MLQSLQSPSRVHSVLDAGKWIQIPKKKVNVKNFDKYRKIGIGLDTHDGVLERMLEARSRMTRRSAFDSAQPTITTASIPNLVQFLQEWLPGMVHVLTNPMRIDDLVPMMTVGSWEDEQVVQAILEQVGTSSPYGDYQNVPLSSWNVNFNTQTVVRFEEGMMVGRLESARSARIQVDDAANKRAAAALALELVRNLTGFYGYNNGLNNTYGLLNAPGLVAYHTVANGGSGDPQWSTKTFLEIISDILYMISYVQTASQDNINPDTTPMTMAVATNAYVYLSQVTEFGISVRQWLNEAYPKIRIVSAPELNTANGGVGVAYLYADQVMAGSSTDDRRTFIQPVPARFQVLGVEQLAKAYIEDYTNATAGVICKRPFAVSRISGIS
jgi:hypothetical protein